MKSRRPPLSRGRIVDAAITLIDEGGLEHFSMPKLAAVLAVRTSALYRHFADREALLAEIARQISAGDEPPALLPAASEWTEFFVAQSMQLRRRILRHPNCAPLIIQFMPKDGVFDQYEVLCQFLAAAGVPPGYHVRIVDALTAMTIGAAVLAESSADYTPKGRGPTPDADKHPALTRALLAIGDATADDLFAGFVRTYLQTILAELHTEESLEQQR